MRVLPLVTVLFLVNVGCSRDFVSDLDTTVRFSSDSIATYILEGKPFPGSDSLGDPYTIAVTSVYVVIGDDKAEKPIIIFDKETGAWIASVGARGDGPGEFEV
ncbi:MAG: 6-bladed beta-propeller [Bacteroidetes bacterium]|nr:6-bladed beta-propeller [Bacteroidota bacterium]